MVSFSLRQRISYRFLKDPSPVSFHLIQFAFSREPKFHLPPFQAGVIVSETARMKVSVFQ